MGFEGFRPTRPDNSERASGDPTPEEVAAEMQRRTNELAQQVGEDALVESDREAITYSPDPLDALDLSAVGLKTPEQQQQLRETLQALGINQQQ